MHMALVSVLPIVAILLRVREVQGSDIGLETDVVSLCLSRQVTGPHLEIGHGRFLSSS
jgi:hypothetical protein